jgi:ABC-type transporter Mla subunit MlaD
MKARVAKILLAIAAWLHSASLLHHDVVRAHVLNLEARLNARLRAAIDGAQREFAEVLDDVRKHNHAMIESVKTTADEARRNLESEARKLRAELESSDLVLRNMAARNEAEVHKLRTELAEAVGQVERLKQAISRFKIPI